MSTNDDFIFEAIRSRYQFEHDRSAHIDTKVTTMVGWIGLIITLILAAGSVLFNPTDFLKILDVSVLYILGASVASLIAALFTGLAAYRMVDFKIVPEPQRLIEKYGDASRTRTLRIYTQMMADAIDYNVRQNRKKIELATATWILFIAGMILSSAFIMIQLSTLMTK
jgi:hypothetical protein